MVWSMVLWCVVFCVVLCCCRRRYCFVVIGKMNRLGTSRVLGLSSLSFSFPFSSHVCFKLCMYSPFSSTAQLNCCKRLHSNITVGENNGRVKVEVKVLLDSRIENRESRLLLSSILPCILYFMFICTQNKDKYKYECEYKHQDNGKDRIYFHLAHRSIHSHSNSHSPFPRSLCSVIANED